MEHFIYGMLGIGVLISITAFVIVPLWNRHQLKKQNKLHEKENKE